MIRNADEPHASWLIGPIFPPFRVNLSQVGLLGVEIYGVDRNGPVSRSLFLVANDDNVSPLEFRNDDMVSPLAWD